MNIAAILLIGAVLVAAAAASAFYWGKRAANKAWAKSGSDLDMLRIVLDNFPFALFVKSVADDYRYVLVNKSAQRSMGLKEAEIVQRTDYDLFSERMADLFLATDRQVIANKKLVDIDAEAVVTAGGTFTSHTIKVPIYDAKGDPLYLLGIFEDISEKSKETERLLQAKDRAEQSERAKSEFLANMSHELRTPLNSILGMARLLTESDLKDEHKVLAKAVYGSSSTLLEIVNDILDLSKIESGTIKLEEIGFDLSYIHQSLVDRLNPLAAAKKLELIKLEDSKPPFVYGDPSRFTRILTNLISNAIKYSEKGQVAVKVSHTLASSKAIFYRCEITDEGIGISTEQQEHIFEKFVQADTSITRRYGGTGLGLAITKQLVELMGGGIGLSSMPGQGSSFWIEIPFQISDLVHRQKIESNEVKKYSAFPPADVRVLIAEDNRLNQAMAEMLMERFRIEHFRIVENGLQAVDCYRTGEWDLILMDCHMPEMSGYDATIAIRALERVNGGHIPIIALTASAMAGDKEKCLSIGMDDYISKPIVFEEMDRVLSQWIDLSCAKI